MGAPAPSPRAKAGSSGSGALGFAASPACEETVVLGPCLRHRRHSTSCPGTAKRPIPHGLGRRRRAGLGMALARGAHVWPDGGFCSSISTSPALRSPLRLDLGGRPRRYVPCISVVVFASAAYVLAPTTQYVIHRRPSGERPSAGRGLRYLACMPLHAAACLVFHSQAAPSSAHGDGVHSTHCCCWMLLALHVPEGCAEEPSPTPPLRPASPSSPHTGMVIFRDRRRGSGIP
jgi:hypothetical protein